MANLKLFHVNKVYDGGVQAVKDFTLDIADKEFVVFVGPSGCGKSTTLRMIAGLEKISSGDCYIGDRLVNALPAKERNISMVFQNYALFPNMSVYDNISYGLRMHGEDKEVIREKVMEAAKMLNLTEHLNRKPSQLSGGQRQRVALGRAIVRNPDVFLLDEPLSNLDAKLRNKMRAEIMALHRRLDATFIYVTHDQVEAMTMGDKIVVMKDGVIMQSGSPALLYQYPANMFVAGFLGTPQMNFWEGEIFTQDGLSVKSAVAQFPLDGELALRLQENAKQDGKKVVVGLRPENIFASRKHPTDIELTAYIRVVEDFCSYGVFHGEINGADIIGQDQVGLELQGKTVKLYADVSGLQIFDAQTEESLMPQYAQNKVFEAVKHGSYLSVLGAELVLPDHLAQNLSDGKLKVQIPVGAYTAGGPIRAMCLNVFASAQGDVSLLRVAGELLHAVGDFSDCGTVGLDLSQVDFIDQPVSAIPTVCALPFTYKKEKGVEDKRTVEKHFCVFSDGRMESYYEFNKKMYRLGRRIFREQFKLYLTPDNVRPAREQEPYPCLQGRVEQVLAFGDKCYSRVSVGTSALYVQAALPVGEKVTLAVDLDNAHVGAAQNDTMFF